MNKEFSKFFIASLKRTAQNVAPILREKGRLLAEIQKREERIESLNNQLVAYDAPIKEATGGYGVEDLVVRTVKDAGVSKDGKPIKVTSWNLRYPETVIPVNEEASNQCDGSIAFDSQDVGEGPMYNEEPETAPSGVNDASQGVFSNVLS